MHFVCFVNFSHGPRDLVEALERMDAACGDLLFDEQPAQNVPAIATIGALANMGA